jgi:ABC-2 type transport system ATP-binding protein
MIMSIIRPDSGAIDVLGSDALHTKDRIGYLPEERGVYRKMRVGEFLSYMGRLKGLPGRGLKEHIQRWLERMDLADACRRRCQELSKGMQQKVQFLAAILHRPSLLILDEPFSGLDPVNSGLLSRLIDELHDQGTTVIFSTHVLAQAEEVCDRIFLINRGQKLLDVSMEEIHARFNPRTIVAEPLGAGFDPGAVAGVRSAAALNGSHRIEIELEEGSDPQDVMRAILSAHPMRSVELRRLSLTEVFVQMVMRGAGEVAAAAARAELAQT